MADFDSAWKETLDTLFEPFMAFFFPVAYREIDWTQPHDPLEQELQKITPASEQGRRVADKLFKVRRTNGQVEWVLGHLKTLQNAHNDDARRVAQVRLVKGLYERGYSAEQVRQLYRLMERMMTLPKPLAELAWNEIHEFEKEKGMTFITTPERVAMEKSLAEGLEKGVAEGLEKGLEKGIELALELRFAAAGWR
jgi:hypothetical protein